MRISNRNGTSVRRLLSILGLAVIAGCGGGSGTTGPAAVFTTRQSGSLLFTLSVPKAAYARGEQVPIMLSVKNTGQQPVVLLLGDRSHNIQISQAGQQINLYPQFVGGFVGGPETIAAGQTITESETWDQKDEMSGLQVQPGQYTVSAWLPASQVNGTPVSDQEAQANLSANPIQVTVQ